MANHPKKDTSFISTAESRLNNFLPSFSAGAVFFSAKPTPHLNAQCTIHNAQFFLMHNAQSGGEEVKNRRQKDRRTEGYFLT